MSDTIQIPAELQQVLDHMQAVEEQYEGIFSIYTAIEAPLRSDWDKLPSSCHKLLASFEQFQAIVAYTLVGPCAQLLEMIANSNQSGEEQASDEQTHAVMEQLFAQGIKMMIKDLKAARRDIPLRNELLAPFRG